VPRRKTSVLILYNSPKPAGWGLSHQSPANQPAFAESEAGVLDEVEVVRRALHKLRIPCRALGVRRFDELPGVLAAADEPVVFNLIEGFWADAQQANVVPAVVHSYGKACTGNDTPGLLFSLDKWQSKILLAAAGIPTPKGLLVPPGRPIPTRDLFEGPYIVKPVQADGSEGISNASLVSGRGPALRRIVQRLHEQLGQPALIEQYIDGRELNVSVISRRGELEVLSPAEIDFGDFGVDRPRIIGYEAKWLVESFEYQHTPRILPARLPRRLTERIRALAAASCRALSCFEYCRVDFRLDPANRPYVLEVNANCDIAPDAGFAAALEAAGISFEAFVQIQIDNAARRVKESVKCQVSSVKTSNFKLQTSKLPIAVRWCRPEDRQMVLSFLAETGFFRPDEIAVARELFDSALAEGPKGHYQSFVATVGSSQLSVPSSPSGDVGRQLSTAQRQPSTAETVGWVCWGPTPCTLGTYDIYWLGVAPAWQGRGIGRALTDFAEQAIAQAGGRLLIVETSSRPTYAPTRRFYEILGYREAGRIPDFYGPGDDRVIFRKSAPEPTHTGK